jgi:hypothetical protein
MDVLPVVISAAIQFLAGPVTAVSTAASLTAQLHWISDKLGVTDKVAAMMRREPERLAFNAAMESTYKYIKAKYPELISSLFDAELFHQTANDLLQYSLRGETPNVLADEVIQAWSNLISQRARTEFEDDVRRAAEDFFQHLQGELVKSEVWRPIIIDRTILRIAAEGTDTNTKVTRLLHLAEAPHDQLEESTGTKLRQPPRDLGLLRQTSQLIGREDEVSWLTEQLRLPGAAVIALRGLGGIGKTAVSSSVVWNLANAGCFADGIAVVPMRGVTDPARVLTTILTRFDASMVQSTFSGEDTVSSAIYDVLASKDALIVLDDIEPTLELSKVVTPLHGANLKVLITARHILSRATVPSLIIREIRPLSPENCLALFAEALGTTSLSPNERHASENIVVALDYHTLAIKLAGAYAADYRRDLATLARELEDSTRVLDLPEGETPRAVAVIFDHSVETLQSQIRELFYAFAIFATADFSRNAAIAVALGLGQTLSEANLSIDTLVGRGLLDPHVNQNMPEGGDHERINFHRLLNGLALVAFREWPIEKKRQVLFALSSYYSLYVSHVLTSALSFDELNIMGVLEWAIQEKMVAIVASLCLRMQYLWRLRGQTAMSLRYLPYGILAAQVVAGSTEGKARSDLCGSTTAYFWSGSLHDREVQ